MKLGPNVRRLFFEFMSVEMIPHGSDNPLATGLASIMKLAQPGNGIAKRAEEKTTAAISAVKLSKDNPYGDDDEAIAQAILEAVDAKKRKQVAAEGAKSP
jgi:hypothetical protein